MSDEVTEMEFASIHKEINSLRERMDSISSTLCSLLSLRKVRIGVKYIRNGKDEPCDISPGIAEGGCGYVKAVKGSTLVLCMDDGRELYRDITEIEEVLL